VLSHKIRYCYSLVVLNKKIRDHY